jgi:hypothetical protein
VHLAVGPVTAGRSLAVGMVFDALAVRLMPAIEAADIVTAAGQQ